MCAIVGTVFLLCFSLGIFAESSPDSSGSNSAGPNLINSNPAGVDNSYPVESTQENPQKNTSGQNKAVVATVANAENSGEESRTSIADSNFANGRSNAGADAEAGLKSASPSDPSSEITSPSSETNDSVERTRDNPGVNVVSEKNLKLEEDLRVFDSQSGRFTELGKAQEFDVEESEFSNQFSNGAVDLVDKSGNRFTVPRDQLPGYKNNGVEDPVLGEGVLGVPASIGDPGSLSDGSHSGDHWDSSAGLPAMARSPGVDFNYRPLSHGRLGDGMGNYNYQPRMPAGASFRPAQGSDVNGVLKNGHYEPQVTWNICDQDQEVAGYFSLGNAFSQYSGGRTPSSMSGLPVYSKSGGNCQQKFSRDFFNFLQAHFKTCTERAARTQISSMDFTHMGVTGDTSHQSKGKSLHNINRAMDLTALYFVDKNQQEHRYVYAAGSAVYLKLLRGSPLSSLSESDKRQYSFWRDFTNCMEGSGGGAIGWENAKHRNHLHLSLPLPASVRRAHGFYAK